MKTIAFISICLSTVLSSHFAMADYSQSEEQIQAQRNAQREQHEAQMVAEYRGQVSAANSRFVACHGGLTSGDPNSSQFSTADGWDCAIGARGMGELDCANTAIGKDFRIGWPIDFKAGYSYIGDGQEALRCFSKSKTKSQPAKKHRR